MPRNWTYDSPQPFDSTKLSKDNQRQERGSKRSHKIVEEEGKGTKNKHNINIKREKKRIQDKRSVFGIRSEEEKWIRATTRIVPLGDMQHGSLDWNPYEWKKNRISIYLRESLRAKIQKSRQVRPGETKFFSQSLGYTGLAMCTKFHPEKFCLWPSCLHTPCAHHLKLPIVQVVPCFHIFVQAAFST